jgi:hypothetical protein
MGLPNNKDLPMGQIAPNTTARRTGKCRTTDQIRGSAHDVRSILVVGQPLPSIRMLSKVTEADPVLARETGSCEDGNGADQRNPGSAGRRPIGLYRNRSRVVRRMENVLAVP